MAHDVAALQNRIDELEQRLERKDVHIEALKAVITLTINGENPAVVMHIIRFILPSRNHTLKKLSLLYLEAVEKVDAAGKLKPEMILVWYAVVALCVFSCLCRRVLTSHHRFLSPIARLQHARAPSPVCAARLLAIAVPRIDWLHRGI